MMDVSGNLLLLRASDQIRTLSFNPLLAGGFLIAFPLVGLIVWICTFLSQPRGRNDFKKAFSRSSQQSNPSSIHVVYRNLVGLFIGDLFNGITSIVLGNALVGYCQSESTCNIMTTVFFLSRSYGIIFHLLVAVISIFYLCHPTQGSRHLSLLSGSSLMITVTGFTYVYARHISFILLAITITGLALTIVIKSLMTVATPPFDTKKKLIALVAMMTFCIIFLPSFVLQCLVLYEGGGDYRELYLNVLFYTSFNVIMDGVLCSLILSLSSGEQELQQQPPPQHSNGLENPEFST